MLKTLFNHLQTIVRRRIFNRALLRGDLSFSAPIEISTSFVIKVLLRNKGEIGRVVAEESAITNTCYIFDIIINSNYRNHGLSTELLKRALRHSGQDSITPVGIVPEAQRYWKHVASVGRFTVLQGVQQKDVEELRYTTGTNKRLTARKS